MGVFLWSKYVVAHFVSLRTLIFFYYVSKSLWSKNTHPAKREYKKKDDMICVMSVENWDIIKLLVQVLPNIIKRKIRKFTRRNEKAPMVIEPIWRGKKRKITPF